MANATAGMSYTPSFPKLRVSSTYACALPLLQSAILNLDKMADTVVRLALQRAKGALSDKFSEVR